MKPIATSLTSITDNISEARVFYEEYFDAKVSFDCGWYVILKIGGSQGGPEIGFMEPREGAQPYGGGAMLNITYPDVDNVYQQISNAGITPVIPLEDHPWGDRGFGVVDPLGTMVYCLTPIEPSDEFKGYQKKL